MDFACVGEWFLGSILFLYLLFPLLRWGLRKQPLLTWVVVLAASCRCITWGGMPAW